MNIPKPYKMKRSVKILIIFLMAGTIVSAQTATNYLILKEADHPRILLLKGEEAAIRQTIATDEVWRKLDRFIVSECDKIIDRPPVERVLTGRRLLDKSREALRRIFYLSYAYRLTSDSKYLERAVKEMLAVSAFR